MTLEGARRRTSNDRPHGCQKEEAAAPAAHPVARQAADEEGRPGRAHGVHLTPELSGLGLTALGIFLATLSYLGWDGGIVGEQVEARPARRVGAAAYVAPAALFVLGALMVSRSELVDVRPFRTGLIVASLGLLLAARRRARRAVGDALGGGLASSLGATGAMIVGVDDAGRRRAAAHGRVGRRAAAPLRPRRPARGRGRAQCSTSHEARPRRRRRSRHARAAGRRRARLPGRRRRGPAPSHRRSRRREPDRGARAALFDVAAESHGDYELPDRALLRRSPPAAAPARRDRQRIADALVQTLAHFGVDATIVGQIAGPRVTRYELQLAPGTKVSKVAALKDDLSYALATTEIRILAPIPGKQAVGVEVPNLARTSSRSATSSTTCPRPRARSPSGWARTSPAAPSGPTSRACRTS